MKKIPLFVLFIFFLLSSCSPLVLTLEVILITPDGASERTYETDIPSSLPGGHYELWCSSPESHPYWRGEDYFGEYRVYLLYTPGNEQVEVSLVLEGSNLVSAMANIDFLTGEFSDLYLLDTDPEAEVHLREYVLGANLASLVFQINVEAPMVAQSYYCVER